MNNPRSSRPWATVYDRHGDPTGDLVGNPEGLRRLRDPIDEALAKGEVAIEKNTGFDFCTIKVQAVHPDERKEEGTKTQAALKLGCSAALMCVGGLLIAGAIKIVEWIAK